MRDVSTPWVGLGALIAMFVLPFLPSWLFEGPRTIRHRPTRHICGVCEAPWTPGHACDPGTDSAADGRRLRGELARLDRPAQLAATGERRAIRSRSG